MGNINLYNGDCLDVLKTLPDNSVDSVVTDPPYGLSKEPDITEVLTHWLNDSEYEHKSTGFMSKSWDSFVPSPLIWKEVFRVLKHGGHLVSFAGSRTQDLMGMSLRLAGFEIRDTLGFITGSGFPHALDISKAIDRKFGLEREVVGKGKSGNQGHVRYTKANLDVGNKKTRDNRNTEFAEKYNKDSFDITVPNHELAKQYDDFKTNLKPAIEPIILARKPISEKTIVDNVIKHGVGGLNIGINRVSYTDDNPPIPQLVQGKVNVDSKKTMYDGNSLQKSKTKAIIGGSLKGRYPANVIIEEGVKIDKNNSDRFFNTVFYGKKVSKRDRTNNGQVENNHPTVKSVEVMEWLVRLLTPKNGVCFDPFMGSGSTGKACKRLGFGFIGIELDKNYFEIAEKRIEGTPERMF